jgi:hypothetical protein
MAKKQLGRPRQVEKLSHWCEGTGRDGQPCRNVVKDGNVLCRAGHVNRKHHFPVWKSGRR